MYTMLCMLAYMIGREVPDGRVVRMTAIQGHEM